MATTIPSIVHLTWKSRDVPEVWQSNYQAWRGLEKQGFEVKLWTDDDNRTFLLDHYPWFMPRYDSYPKPIQRADAVRPFYLYHYGGIYSDLDIGPGPEFLRLFQLLREEPVVIGRSSHHAQGHEIHTNALMMGRAQHPFWLEVIERLSGDLDLGYKRVLAKLSYFQTIFHTGPGIINDTIRLTPGEKPLPLGLPFFTNDCDAQTPTTKRYFQLAPGSSWHGSGDAWGKAASGVWNKWAVWILLAAALTFGIATTVCLSYIGA